MLKYSYVSYFFPQNLFSPPQFPPVFSRLGLTDFLLPFSLFTSTLMKKIGLLFGESSSFAQELIGTLNIKGPEDLVAESIQLTSISHGRSAGYDLIFNLHPQNPPLYQSFLQAEALAGCQVLNNPFLFPGFDRFVASVAADNVLLNVVPTHLLPSYELPPENSHRSFPNLGYPWNWEKIFEEVGFPAIMKPVRGGEAHHIHKVDSAEEFFEAQRESGNQPMILQEFVDTEEIYLCFYIGNSYQEVMVVPFDPAHGTFHSEEKNSHPILSDTLKMHTRAFAGELGCDFAAVAFAISKEEPYLIDIHNPINFLGGDSLGPARFRNLLNGVADLVIERVYEKTSLSWGSLLPQEAHTPPPTDSDSVATPPELPDRAKEQLLVADLEGKEADSHEFLLIDTSPTLSEAIDTPSSGELVELTNKSYPKEPPAVTYTESSQLEEEQNWAQFKKEEMLKEEVIEEVALEPFTHLPPQGIDVSATKHRVMKRIASRIHQINFHRIGRAMESEQDDLKKIFGIGPFIEEKLHALQLFTFRQIAQFNQEDERIINEILEFYPGRIERDEWVKQAKELMG